jgi:hypothetical protein
MSEEIGFLKEAARRRVAPVIWFMADTDRVSARGHEALRAQIPSASLVTVDNEYVVRGELPVAMSHSADRGAPAFPEGLCRPVELFVQRLSAQREGCLGGTAPMVAQKLSQLPRAGTELDPAEIVSTSSSLRSCGKKGKLSTNSEDELSALPRPSPDASRRPLPARAGRG